MATDLLQPPKPNGKIGVDLVWKMLTAVTLGVVLWMGSSVVKNSIQITENRADLDRNTDRTKDRYTRSEAHKDFTDMQVSIDRLVELVLVIEKSRGGRNVNKELEKIAERLAAIEAKLGIGEPKDESNP